MKTNLHIAGPVCLSTCTSGHSVSVFTKILVILCDIYIYVIKLY